MHQRDGARLTSPLLFKSLVVLWIVAGAGEVSSALEVTGVQIFAVPTSFGEGAPIYLLDVEVEGSQLDEVSVTPPNGPRIDLECAPGGFFCGWTSAPLTESALNLAFPDGNYVFDFNQTEDDAMVTHTRPVPPRDMGANPVFVVPGFPSHLGTTSLAPTFTWFIGLWIYDDSYMEVASLDGFGGVETEVLVLEREPIPPSGEFTPSSIPDEILLVPGTVYSLELTLLTRAKSQRQTTGGDAFAFTEGVANSTFVQFLAVNPSAVPAATHDGQVVLLALIAACAMAFRRSR